MNGVREHFRRRFGYECAGYPTFDELERDDNLDIEVACSGFTKQMEKDLLQEYGMESVSDVEDSDDEKIQSEDETENNEEELDRLREQVEAEVKFSEERAKERDTSKVINFNIQNYIASLAQQPDGEEQFEDAMEEMNTEIPLPKAAPKPDTNEMDKTIDSVADVRISDSNSVDGNVSSGGEFDDELTDLDPKSREYRIKMVEKILSDARSHRSYSTSASTIAPSVVKDRIKKTLNVKEKREQRKRCIAKGEASAVTRVRNENRDTCKQYAGWDF